MRNFDFYIGKPTSAYPQKILNQLDKTTGVIFGGVAVEKSTGIVAAQVSIKKVDPKMRQVAFELAGAEELAEDFDYEIVVRVKSNFKNTKIAEYLINQLLKKKNLKDSIYSFVFERSVFEALKRFNFEEIGDEFNVEGKKVKLMGG